MNETIDNVIVKSKVHSYNEGKPTRLFITLYEDKSLALQVEDVDEGIPLRSTISVNLSGYGEVLKPYCVFIKNYSEGAGLVDSLVKAGIGEVVRTVKIGFGSGFEFKLASCYHEKVNSLYRKLA